MLSNRAKVAAAAGINKALVSSPSWVKKSQPPAEPTRIQSHTTANDFVQPYFPPSSSSSTTISTDPPGFRSGGRLVRPQSQQQQQQQKSAPIGVSHTGINISVAQYVSNRVNGSTSSVINIERNQHQQTPFNNNSNEVANIPMTSLVRTEHSQEIQDLFKLFQKNYDLRMQLLDRTSEAFGAFSRVINNKSRNSRVKCKTIYLKERDEEILSFLVNPEGSAAKASRPAVTRKVGARATIGSAKKAEQRPSKHVGVWNKCHELFWGTHSSTFDNIPGRTSEDLPQNQRSEYASTCHGTGCIHGNYVHQQWRDIMNYLRAGRGITISQYLVDFPSKRIDPCVIRLMKILDAMDCIPWRSEFPIFDEFAYLGTMIDLICWRVPIHRGNYKNQCSVYLELKTGYDFGPFKTELPTDKDMLNLPLWQEAPIKDTPYHRAALQMLVTLLILQQRYGYLPDVPGIIHLSSRKGMADFFPMPDWSFDPAIRKHVYKVLSLTMPKICFDRINKGAKIQDYDTIGAPSNLRWSYDYNLSSSSSSLSDGGNENRPIIGMEELNRPPPQEDEVEEEEETVTNPDDEEFIDDDGGYDSESSDDYEGEVEDDYGEETNPDETGGEEENYEEEFQGYDDGDGDYEYGDG
jgi:hypothetical protein